MKTYSFNICKYHVTITIERKMYEPAVEKSAEQCSYSFTGWNYDEALKPNTVDTKNVEFGETVVYHGPFPGDESEELKMEEPERLCLMEAAEKYIDSKRGELAASTIKGYENIVYHHLDDVWLIYLTKLTEEHLQNAFNNEIEKGLSVKTLKGYKTFILKVLAEYRSDFYPNIRVTKETADEIA